MGKTLKDILNFTKITFWLGSHAIIGASGAIIGISLVEKENPLETAKRIYANFIPKKEMPSDALQLNTNDFMYYVTNKNEEKGINDIKKIINNSNYEEEWLYLPEKQIWYEIGINSDSNSVKHSSSHIDKILEENKEVKELIFYHNHPGEGPSLKSPSMKDIKSMTSTSLYFSDYKVKEKICSKKGITEYFLTEEAIKEFKLKDSINLKDYYNYEKDSSITFDLEYFRINFKPHENIK